MHMRLMHTPACVPCIDTLFIPVLLSQLDAPVVTQAFLKHDMDTLRDHCGPEIMQRLEGLCNAARQQVRRRARGCGREGEDMGKKARRKVGGWRMGEVKEGRRWSPRALSTSPVPCTIHVPRVLHFPMLVLAQEIQEDPTILNVSDVEVVEVRMMDNDPFIIAQFHCQQIKCVRDK
jgi:hypothetical protein